MKTKPADYQMDYDYKEAIIKLEIHLQSVGESIVGIGREAKDERKV